MKLDDPGTLEQIQAKMNLLQRRMDDLDMYWDEQTKGLYLDTNGQLIGPDGHPIPMRSTGHQRLEQGHQSQLTEMREIVTEATITVTETTQTASYMETDSVNEEKITRNYQEPSLHASIVSGRPSAEEWQDIEIRLREVSFI